MIQIEALVRYFSPNEISSQFNNFFIESISVFHLKIRSIRKNVEAFQEFYNSLNFKFRIFVSQKHGLMIMIILIKTRI